MVYGEVLHCVLVCLQEITHKIILDGGVLELGAWVGEQPLDCFEAGVFVRHGAKKSVSKGT